MLELNLPPRSRKSLQQVRLSINNDPIHAELCQSRIPITVILFIFSLRLVMTRMTIAGEKVKGIWMMKTAKKTMMMMKMMMTSQGNVVDQKCPRHQFGASMTLKSDALSKALKNLEDQ